MSQLIMRAFLLFFTYVLFLLMLLDASSAFHQVENNNRRILKIFVRRESEKWIKKKKVKSIWLTLLVHPYELRRQHTSGKISYNADVFSSYVKCVTL